VAHEESLLPETLALADGAQGVLDWAAAQGLAIDAGLSSKLAGTGAAKFLVVRFNAPAGAASTPTLRITAPLGLAVLPFSITTAGTSNVRVTAWLFGEGRASFTGTTAALVPESAIVWDAKSGKSSYVALRDELLAGDADRDALESAGHDALIDATPFADGTASIDAVMPVYFERASAYGNALPAHVDEALSFLVGLRSRVRCSSAFAPLVQPTIARHNGAELVIDDSVGPGVVAEAADGAITVDDTLAARLARAEPRLAIELSRKLGDAGR
jgi:hypothetical protein